MNGKLKELWTRLGLARQFAIASLAVIASSMLAAGWWINREIEEGVTRTTAETTALYIGSFIAPEVQELAAQDRLSDRSIAVLKHLLGETPLGERIVSIKVWGTGGNIVYSNQPSLIGRSFPTTPSLRWALAGNVVSELSELDEAENSLESQIGVPLLETYSPVRERGSDRVIAVIEFYARADDLVRELERARLRGWLIVAIATIVIFGLLYGIVREGSKTISAQQSELQARVRQLSNLLARNQELHRRVREAANRATELNERVLRRISRELHDGPARALGFALLRFDAVKEALAAREVSAMQGLDLDRIRLSLKDALKEIRDLCGGMALPELDGLSFPQTIRRVVRAHETKTETQVELSLDAIPDTAALPLKINVYRFIQEALANAYRHGGGKAQRVEIRMGSSGLEVAVSDGGEGFDPGRMEAGEGRLGLIGMRRRVESFGGRFALESTPGGGARVTGTFPLSEREVELA